jgi:hypothetical protein
MVTLYYIYNIILSSIPKIIITAKLRPLMDSTQGTTAHLLGSYDFKRATAVTGILLYRVAVVDVVHSHGIFFRNIIFIKTEWSRCKQIVFQAIK